MKSRIFALLIVVAMLACPACALLETQTDATGKEVTTLESVLGTAKQGIGLAAPIANVVFPGAVTIAGGIGTILGLIGSTATAIVVARRRGKALKAVMHAAQPTKPGV